MNKPLKERASARADTDTHAKERTRVHTHTCKPLKERCKYKDTQCYGIAKQKLDALRTFRDKTRR
jgi:hypothetical protein